MKMILAIVRPHRLQDVKQALLEIGVLGMTVTDVRGSGKQKGQVERYRGSEYKIDLLPKCRVEVAVTNDQSEEAIQAIRKAAHSGEIGRSLCCRLRTQCGYEPEKEAKNLFNPSSK